MISRTQVACLPLRLNRQKANGCLTLELNYSKIVTHIVTSCQVWESEASHGLQVVGGMKYGGAGSSQLKVVLCSNNMVGGGWGGFHRHQRHVVMVTRQGLPSSWSSNSSLTNSHPILTPPPKQILPLDNHCNVRCNISIYS